MSTSANLIEVRMLNEHSPLPCASIRMLNTKPGPHNIHQLYYVFDLLHKLTTPYMIDIDCGESGVGPYLSYMREIFKYQADLDTKGIAQGKPGCSRTRIYCPNSYPQMISMVRLMISQFFPTKNIIFVDSLA